MSLRAFLEKVLLDSCAVTEMCKRKTVTTTDVVFALHRMGRTIYVSCCLSLWDRGVGLGVVVLDEADFSQ